MTNKDDMDRLKEELFKSCQDVQKFIYTLTTDKYAKEEIFQNTLMRAYENLDKLRNSDRLISWLFEIVKTETARHYKKEKKWNQFKEVVFDEVSVDDYEEDVAELLEGLEDKSKIVDCLKQLRPEYEGVIRAHYLYHISLVDLAKIWDINYNTLKTFHRRALKELRALFFEAGS